ncbi:sushi domain-containing protein 3-like isoform X2 [Arapaima gigas]
MTAPAGPGSMDHLWPFLWTMWGMSMGVAVASGSSVSPILLRTSTVQRAEEWSNVTEPPSGNSTDLSCIPLLPPRRGSFYVEIGSGVSLGTVLAFWCHEGYQLVGSEKISCIIHGGRPQWSNYLPVCEAIPRPEDKGLRVAVLVSVVSSVIIIAMSASFLICCLQERVGKERGHRRDSRPRKRVKKRSQSQRSECWLEQEEGDWDAFPPPKVFHLSHKLDHQPPSSSPLYTGGLDGYENHGYQRSQESLLKTPLPGLYCTESQVYPHVVLQRVPTPTAPVCLHFPAQATEPLHPPQVSSDYGKPTYHSSLQGIPQRPWP